jgi:hypothetical protein
MRAQATGRVIVRAASGRVLPLGGAPVDGASPRVWLPCSLLGAQQMDSSSGGASDELALGIAPAGD